MPDPIARSDEQPPRRSGSQPGSYRVYDVYLNGKDNYRSDNELAQQVIGVLPTIKEMSVVNRRFVLNAPRYLAAVCGVRQFLDIGSGAPSTTKANLHDAVLAAAPEARVVYVDNDPISVMHGQTHLDGHPQVAMVEGDMREPEAIMNDPAVTDLLDFSRPVAVCAHTLMHFILDQEDPRGLLATVMEPLPSGSYLSMTHGTGDAGAHVEAASEPYRQAGIAMQFRTRYEIQDLLEGLQLLDPPGILPVQDWAPPGQEPEPCDLPEGEFGAYGLVARKP